MDPPTNHCVQICKLLHASVATLRFHSSCCEARIGPLAHVIHRANRNGAPHPRSSTEHLMLDGTYRVYRVERTTHRLTGNEEPTVDVLTVITLQEVDPLKIVAHVARRVVTDDRLAATGKMFDGDRWLQLVGKTRTRDTLLGQSTRPTRRDLVQRRLAITSCIGRKNGQVVLSNRDMDEGDVNSIYVHPTSKQLIGPIECSVPATSSPGLVEFIVTNQRVPVALGVTLPKTEGGVHGCVLYTHSTQSGRNLAEERAFAVVIGPACLLTRSDTGTNIRHPVWCGDFFPDKTVVSDSICQLGHETTDGSEINRPGPGSTSTGPSTSTAVRERERIGLDEIINDKEFTGDGAASSISSEFGLFSVEALEDVEEDSVDKWLCGET